MRSSETKRARARVYAHQSSFARLAGACSLNLEVPICINGREGEVGQLGLNPVYAQSQYSDLTRARSDEDVWRRCTYVIQEDERNLQYYAGTSKFT